MDTDQSKNIKENTCEYCNKQFSTKSNLTAHKKTSKSCKISCEKTEFACENCNKKFSTGQNLKTHNITCSIKLDNEKEIIYKELKKKDEEIKKLNERINVLTIENKVLETRLEDKNEIIEVLKNNQNKGSNTTNNTTHIHGDKTVIFNAYFTPEFLSEGMKDYDENLVCHGMPGLAAYVKERFLKMNGKLIYTCTDAARQHFKFTYDGKEINDKTAAMLVQSLKPTLTNHLKYLTKKLNTTEDKLESIPKSDRTKEQETKLDVTKHIITNKLTPLTIDVRELETNHKLSLELSRLV